MRKVKCIYLAWLIALFPLAILWKVRYYSGTAYFVINMIAMGILYFASVEALLKIARDKDESICETIKACLLTRTKNINQLKSSVTEVENEIQKYKDLFPLSIADIAILLIAEMYINLL